MRGRELIEAEYRAPYVAHQPLEPISAIALVRDDSAEVWTCTMFHAMMAGMVATITGLKPEQVVFHNQWAGGSFGHRADMTAMNAAVDVANQMRGTPVKLTFSREEDFQQDIPRQISMARNRGAVEKGKIVAADIHVASPSLARSQFAGRLNFPMSGPDTTLPNGIWSAPYAIPNFRNTIYAVDGLSPVSSWRSVGASTGGFFTDCFIDELIHAAGLDPLPARIDMCQFEAHRGPLASVKELQQCKGQV